MQALSKCHSKSDSLNYSWDVKKGKHLQGQGNILTENRNGNSVQNTIPDPGIYPSMKCNETGKAFKGRVSKIPQYLKSYDFSSSIFQHTE